MTIEEQSIGKLKSRVHLGSMLIKMLHQDDDPKAAEAIERLQKQQRILNKVLVAKIKAEREVEPPPIVVGCKPVVLSGRARGSPAAQQTPTRVIDTVEEADGSVVLTLQL